jgi:hypothetical protein
MTRRGLEVFAMGLGVATHPSETATQ